MRVYESVDHLYNHKYMPMAHAFAAGKYSTHFIARYGLKSTTRKIFLGYERKIAAVPCHKDFRAS